MEKPALLVIDMVKDNFRKKEGLGITEPALKIIDPINGLIRAFRNKDWPVIFATDAFHKNDFIFKGRMKPHSLADTQGAEVIDEGRRSVASKTSVLCLF